MTLSLRGVLPVGSINLGLAASLSGLNAEIVKLQADLAGLNVALAGQVNISAGFPPNPAFAATFAGWLTPAQIAATFALSATAGFGANAELTIKLGLVTAQVELVAALLAPIELGLTAPGIAGWSYAGRAPRFGTELATATAGGFANFAPDTPVTGIVIATENYDSWVSFSAGFDTGTSALVVVGVDVADLHFLGARGGDRWNIGTSGLIARLRLFLAELQGLQAQLEASIQVSLGLNLPDITALLNAGLAVDVTAALDSLVNAQIDFGAEITGLTAQIEVVVNLAASISSQLAAGSLAVWAYDGTAGALGSELATEIADGVPNGTGPATAAYGVALVAAPADFALFGNIFVI